METMKSITNHSTNGSSTIAIEGMTDRKKSSFIEANTMAMEFSEIASDHIIPVYNKDNEPLISHTEFIDCVQSVVHHYFGDQQIADPEIRVSHPVKGRVPEAKGKPADQLKEDERTLYYERMAFIIRLPGLIEQIEGDPLALSIGGVKTYSIENRNGKKGNPEHFKVFIGFLNRVCTNLCVWTDGFTGDLLAGSQRELEEKVYRLVSEFSYSSLTNKLGQFPNWELSEYQFAQFLGRCRLYQFLPSHIRGRLPELKLTDSQLSAVASGFYRDSHYAAEDSRLSLWQLYNLLTGANKSSYIDTFLDRGVNAYQLTVQLGEALDMGQDDFWFLGN